MNNKGFTLAELMAVVIIVAILSAIAMGSYKRAVERSRISDGLLAASSVLEAVNRYQADKFPDADAGYPTYNQLDISFPNEKDCTAPSDYCKKTKYFEITINSGDANQPPRGSVDAKRMKGGVEGDFTIRIYSDTFGANKTHQPECIGTNEGGRDLCIAAGYTTCTGTYVCTKQ